LSSVNPYINDILQWRDSLSKMPDHHFFELLRMYLGDIKTPYNKQKLIEQLSAFLRHDSNRKNIAMLLSKSDILIIAAVDALPMPTQDKLLQFFASEFSIADLYERLMNLEERLLLFRVYEGDTALSFKVNPLLRVVIDPLLTDDILIPSAKLEFFSEDSHIDILSTSILGAWLSFTEQNTDLCKADGTFKKKTLLNIKKVFPLIKNTDFFLYLTKAMHNLKLFRVSNGNYKPIYPNWDNFATMNKESEIAYICVAATGRFSREQLHVNAQLVCDILESMSNRNFTNKVLVRAAYLQLQKKGSVRTESIQRGRFATMLQKNDIEVSVPIVSTSNLEKIISIMQIFGLLETVGTTAGGDPVYRKSHWLSSVQTQTITPGTVVINAGFSVTILQELSLVNLIDIIKCMDIDRLDGVAEYKITRSSCMRCYDSGTTPKDITDALAPAIAHEIPQNLQFSLEDWYKNYCSASLYKGYVLRVDSDKQVLIKNTPELAQYIQQELAPGVFLVNFESDEEAIAVFSKSNLDFIGAVKNIGVKVQPVPYPSIRIDTKATQVLKTKIEQIKENSKAEFSETSQDLFLDDLKDTLSKQNLEAEQSDGLLSRINRKIIVNPDQLRGDSVRPEKIEASGMDFLGKVHVVEHAILSKSFLKILVSDLAAVKGSTEILGLPLSVEKKDGDVHVKIRLEPTGEITILSIGQAKSVKRIRGAIFKEQEY
jgi:hypothetical protein